MNYLSEIANEETERNLFQAMILYLYSASRNFTNKDYNEIKGLIEQTQPKRSEDMKSFADILREEGMDKGIEKGMEKGKEESNKEFISNLLNDGKNIDTIVKYTGLSKDQVKRIIEEIEH